MLRYDMTCHIMMALYDMSCSYIYSMHIKYCMYISYIIYYISYIIYHILYIIYYLLLFYYIIYISIFKYIYIIFIYYIYSYIYIWKLLAPPGNQETSFCKTLFFKYHRRPKQWHPRSRRRKIWRSPAKRDGSVMATWRSPRWKRGWILGGIFTRMCVYIYIF